MKGDAKRESPEYFMDFCKYNTFDGLAMYLSQSEVEALSATDLKSSSIPALIAGTI